MNTARPESARREAADRTIRDLARDLANHDPHPADLDPGNVAALRGLLDRHHAASRAPDACAYAGIGSRRTPPEVLAAMATLAETLGNAGCALSTGGAHGADQAFEAGALRTDAPITVHTPWPGYNDYRPGREPESDIDVVRPQPADLLRGETYLDLARRHHPHWDRCGRGARALFLRNVSILSGASARHGSRIAIAAVVAYTVVSRITSLEGQDHFPH